MSKLTFVNNPHPFKNLLDERIEQYFSSKQIPQRGNWQLYSKTIILFISLFSVYGAILSIQPPTWLTLLLCGLLGFIQATMDSMSCTMLHMAVIVTTQNSTVSSRL